MDIVLDSNKITKAIAISINNLINNDKAQIESIEIANDIEMPLKVILCNERTKDGYQPEDQQIYKDDTDYKSMLNTRIKVFTEIRNDVLSGKVRCLSAFRSDFYKRCFHHNMTQASSEWHSLAKTVLDQIDFLLSIGIVKLNKIER